jgi:hypothetical protein
MIAAMARKTNARGDEATTPEAPELLFVGAVVAPVEVPVAVLEEEVEVVLVELPVADALEVAVVVELEVTVIMEDDPEVDEADEEDEVEEPEAEEEEAAPPVTANTTL